MVVPLEKLVGEIVNDHFLYFNGTHGGNYLLLGEQKEYVDLLSRNTLTLVEQLTPFCEERMVINCGHYSFFSGEGPLFFRRDTNQRWDPHRPPSPQAIFSFIVGTILAKEFNGRVSLYVEDLGFNAEERKEFRNWFHIPYTNISKKLGYLEDAIDLRFESDIKKALLDKVNSQQIKGLSFQDTQTISPIKYLVTPEGHNQGYFFFFGHPIKYRNFRPSCSLLLGELHTQLREMGKVLSIFPEDEIMCGSALPGLPGEESEGVYVFRQMNKVKPLSLESNSKHVLTYELFQFRKGEYGYCHTTPEKMPLLNILVLEDLQLEFSNRLANVFSATFPRYANKFRVKWCRTYEEAFRAVASLKEERYHIAILDHGVPPIVGTEPMEIGFTLTDIIKEFDPYCCVVGFSIIPPDKITSRAFPEFMITNQDKTNDDSYKQGGRIYTLCECVFREAFLRWNMQRR